MPLVSTRTPSQYYRYEPVGYVSSRDVNGKFTSYSNGSDSIRTGKVSQKGLGVVATNPIPTTSHICSITRPIMVALDTPRLKDTCYSCFKQPKDKQELTLERRRPTDEEEKQLKVCTGCRVVRFCDRSCQAQAWKLYHQLECPVFEALHPRVLPNNVRAVVRLLLQKKHQNLPPRMWEHIHELEDHIDKLRDAGGERWENLVIMAQAAKEYSKTDQSFMIVLKLFCRLMVNGMTLITTWGDPIGLFLHPLLSRINHSCRPNAFIHTQSTVTNSHFWSPRTIELVPLRNINPGEEIKVAYVDANDDVHIRQKQLQEQYFFTCTCSKCKKELAPDFKPCDGINLLQTDTFKETQASALSHVEAADTATSINRKIESLRYAIYLMEQTKCWPLSVDPYPKAQHGLILAYIEASQFDYALMHAALQHFDIDPLVYADYTIHPTRNTHKFLLIRLMTLLLEDDCWTSQTLGLEKMGVNLKWWRAKLKKELHGEFRKTSVFHDMAEALGREHETSSFARVKDEELNDTTKQDKAMQGMRKVIDTAYERNRTWNVGV